jgi:hypothetical protein
VSTFYLLPPRPFLGRWLVERLKPVFPHLASSSGGGTDLPGLLASAIERPDVFVVHREDLPQGEDPARALQDGFGAEPGDEVIEVVNGPTAGELLARCWRVAGP